MEYRIKKIPCVKNFVQAIAVSNSRVTQRDEMRNSVSSANAI